MLIVQIIKSNDIRRSKRSIEKSSQLQSLFKDLKQRNFEFSTSVYKENEINRVDMSLG